MKRNGNKDENGRNNDMYLKKVERIFCLGSWTECCVYFVFLS